MDEEEYINDDDLYRTTRNNDDYDRNSLTDLEEDTIFVV
jgi:hypothetical protein